MTYFLEHLRGCDRVLDCSILEIEENRTNPTITVKATLPQTFLEISGKQAERLSDG
jgi:hypothetical protein